MADLQLLVICNALTKSAAKVLTAFIMAGQPLDTDGLIQWTRMERHSIDVALRQLRDYGLVVRQVAAHNRAIWVLATNIFPEMRRLDELREGRNNPITVIQNDGNPQFGGVSRTPEQQADLERALDAYQIVGKKRRELMGCEWVTGEYIHGHVRMAQSENHWDQPVGMAISRMLDHAPLPDETQAKTRNKYAMDQFMCSECCSYPCICDESEEK
jgi:hypothetical protein